MSGTTALTGASRCYYGCIAYVCAYEERVASLLPQHAILIILIPQAEPSGSEAGEPRVRNRVREIWPTKQLTHAL
jgi:hypothetical protein